MQWFTSDTHFGHENLLTKMGRVGFSSVSEHDERLLESINRCVGKGDSLHILGDFAFSKAQKYRGLIRCKQTFLVIGNHDRPLDSVRAFGQVWHIKDVKTEYGRICCCHYPMAFWPASHHGAMHLYGHCHDQREATMDRWMPTRRSMDVGVDVAYRLLGEHRPFSLEEIVGLIGGREGHDQVSFYDTLRASQQTGEDPCQSSPSDSSSPPPEPLMR